VSSDTTTREVWIKHPRGQMYATTTEPGACALDTPIVLLHDSLGSVELWRDFPAALAEGTGRRVIAYDRLGFGRSDARCDLLSREFVADEAETYFPVIREELGLERFVLFGHSVGGGMALHCAAKFADACDAVITESAQAFVEDRTLDGIRVAKEQFEQDGQLARLEKYHGDKAAWVLNAWTGTWLSREFADWSLASVLPRVRCPLLVIHGMEDEYGSRRHPEMIAKGTSGRARLKLMADTHHVPHRERQREVVEMVAAFLRGS
jgi:pimeloyl-ACP methyl ester carboxylesterase